MTTARVLSAISVLTAVGVVSRVFLGRLALVMPTQIYGVFIKVGLTETLAFVAGFVFGPIQGFLVGSLVIVTSDLFMMPGPWTPFIAVIIALFGVAGGVLGRFKRNPNGAYLGMWAVGLTLFSEMLQNLWFALFFGMPISVVLAMGIPSMVAATVNNTILLTAAGPRIIKILREMVISNPH